MRFLWGPSRDHDYWAALRAGLVPGEERRAVALLASMTDESRFSAYCMTGQLAAMGNATKRIYMVRRHTGVLELEDGRPKTSWCIHGPDRNQIPETDHVVLMRNLIEGEELAFRMTGNPTDMLPWWDSSPEEERIRTPFTASVLGGGPRASVDENADFTDFMDMHRARKRAIERGRGEREGRLAMLTFRKRMWDAFARAGARRADAVPERDIMREFDGRAGIELMMDVPPGCDGPPRRAIRIDGFQNGPYGRTTANTAIAFTGSSITNNNIYVTTLDGIHPHVIMGA